MKKILLIVAVVVCVAVAGTALALTQFNSATPVSGTLTADTYLALDWGECTTGDLVLEEGVYTTYTIAYTVTKSTNAPAGTLTLSISNSAPKSVEYVNVALFTDSNCTTPLKLNATTRAIDAEGTAVTQNGQGTITINGLTADGIIYARFGLSSGATVSEVGGSMTLVLAEQA